MKTYTFTNKNEPITIIISASSFTKAEEMLFSTVKNSYGWRLELEED